MIARTLAPSIQRDLRRKGRAVIVYGARQVGKTTLIRHVLQEAPDTVSFVGDDLYTQSLLERHELEHLKRIVGSAAIVFIDEAQRIDNIGLTLKLLVDHLPVTVVASGSASFELANRLSEPLTGRSTTYQLHPLSWAEVAPRYATTSPTTALEEMLRFGMYPRVHTLETDDERQQYLYNYVNNYLYRDILEFEQVKKPKKVIDLLVMLAHQVGNEASVVELSNGLNVSKKTVDSYLDVLEKMFVLIRVGGFSRNLRKEVTKSSRYYFVDVGIRNALVRSFAPLALRTDVGALFENWFVSERVKHASNAGRFTGFHFWRTYDRQEIDLIEDFDGGLRAFECKWSDARVRVPSQWRAAYPGTSFDVVTRESWRAFLEEGPAQAANGSTTVTPR